MSRIRNDYENSLWCRLVRWVNGETNPFAGKMEMEPLRETEVVGDSVFNPDRLDKEKVEQYVEDIGRNKEMKAFRILYNLASVSNRGTSSGGVLDAGAWRSKWSEQQ